MSVWPLVSGLEGLSSHYRWQALMTPYLIIVIFIPEWPLYSRETGKAGNYILCKTSRTFIITLRHYPNYCMPTFQVNVYKLKLLYYGSWLPGTVIKNLMILQFYPVLQAWGRFWEMRWYRWNITKRWLTSVFPDFFGGPVGRASVINKIWYIYTESNHNCDVGYKWLFYCLLFCSSVCL